MNGVVRAHGGAARLAAVRYRTILRVHLVFKSIAGYTEASKYIFVTFVTIFGPTFFKNHTYFHFLETTWILKQSIGLKFRYSEKATKNGPSSTYNLTLPVSNAKKMGLFILILSIQFPNGILNFRSLCSCA